MAACSTLPQMSRNGTIRAAIPADLDAIIKIDRESPPAAHWPEVKYLEAIDQPERLVLVGEESGQVSGFLVALIVTAEWELENIAVAQSSRRRGMGRALMQALIGRAMESFASEIRQEIRASNLPAQLLGQSVGFVQQGRRPGYYRKPDEDALLFNYLVRPPQKAR